MQVFCFCFCFLHDKTDCVDMIKDRNMGRFSWIPQRVHLFTWVLKHRGCVAEKATWDCDGSQRCYNAVLKQKEGIMSPGEQVAWRNWKRPGNRFSSRTPARSAVLPTPDFSQVTATSDCWRAGLWDNRGAIFSPWVRGALSRQRWKMSISLRKSITYVLPEYDFSHHKIL